MSERVEWPSRPVVDPDLRNSIIRSSMFALVCSVCSVRRAVASPGEIVVVD